MNFYRLAKKKFALDRLGVGASRTGGRWNSRDVPVVYCASTPELAALERLVHIGTEEPQDLVLVEIRINQFDSLLAALKIRTAKIKQLPLDWNVLPSSPSAAQYGDQFVAAGKELGLLVPSVIVPESTNMVLNPNHELMREVTFTILRDFRYDLRLLA